MMSIVDVLRRWWRMRYPACLVAFLAGLALMWLPYRSSVESDSRAQRLAREGVPAEATVYNLERKGRRSQTMHVSYELAGVVRQSEVACREACYERGASLRIWVNPDDPGEFVTESGTLSGHQVPILGILGLAGLALSGWALLAGLTRYTQQRAERKKRELKQRRRDEWRQRPRTFHSSSTKQSKRRRR